MSYKNNNNTLTRIHHLLVILNNLSDHHAKHIINWLAIMHTPSPGGFKNVNSLTEQNRNLITLKLLQFLVTLHTYSTIYNFGDKTGIITMDELCVKI